MLSLYKNQLNQTTNDGGHHQQELKDNTPVKTNSSEGRIQNLRKSAITKFGSDMYNKIYSHMTHHRQKGTADDQLKKSLTDMVGKVKYGDCQIIDEIIFLESVPAKKWNYELNIWNTLSVKNWEDFAS